MDGDLYDILIFSTRRHRSSNLVYFAKNSKKYLQYNCISSLSSISPDSETFCSPLIRIFLPVISRGIL